MVRNYIYVVRVFILLLFSQTIAFSQETEEAIDSVIVVEELTIPLTEIPEQVEYIENYLREKVISRITDPDVQISSQVLDSLLLLKDELSIVTKKFGESNLPLEFYQNTAFK